MLMRSLALALSLAGATPLAAQVTFPTPRTTLWAARSQTLTFDVAEAAAEERAFEVRVRDGACVSALGEAVVLAGATRGYLRVAAHEPGACTLEVAGVALAVEVRDLPQVARPYRVEPRISAPATGCVIWGTIAVGVEVSGSPSDVVLLLPNGEVLAEPRRAASDDAVTQRLVFDVDCATLPAGTGDLQAVADGARSGRVTVTVVHPDAGALLSGECEDALDLPRPAAFGAEAPPLGASPDASGGRFVNNAAPRPLWTLPLDLPEAGRYQLMLTARGEMGGGAFPSCGIYIDEIGMLHATTRLVDRRWHRMPVGPPLRLEAGAQCFALQFINERNVYGRSDRNLYLDKWELLRIEDEAAAPEMNSMMMMGGMGGSGGDGLWVALERPLDGLSINGRLELVGACSWTGAEELAAPHVSLMVDGRALARQQAARPRFIVQRAHLGEGEHELWLEARMADGRSARTPVQRVHVPGPVGGRAPLDVTRISVLDERWDASVQGALDGQNEEARQRCLRPREAATFGLALPEELVGEYEVFLESRGPGADARVTVLVGDAEVGAVDVRGWWQDRPAGSVTLAAGAKRLELFCEPSARRELRVRAVLLRPVQTEDDRTPPAARILYPSDGHVAHGVDAVVVEAFDDDKLQVADVLIDGRPQTTFGFIPDGAGHVVLPLLLRDLPPGEHGVQVRLRDRSGNMADSREVTIEVLDARPVQPGRYARARDLLDRLAFGPDPRELAELLVHGEEAWLASALGERGTGDATARGLAKARHADRIAYDGDRLLLTHALRTDNPVRTRFVLWVDDHFSTWSGKTGMPSEWVEYEEYARLGFTPFPELLFASASSPAMLFYLDQQNSTAGRLNENYARELMELHTVGVDGGYTQEEVTALASLLTGLTVSNEAPETGVGNFLRRVFRFAPELGDGRPCTLLGKHFPRCAPQDRYDRFREALEVLAAHPSTARFLCTKLAEHYVAAPAPEALVDALVPTFLESGGDFRAVLARMTEHDAFWAAAAAPRLTTPLDFGVRLARVIDVPETDWAVRQFLDNAGMGLFDRATPDGYPDDDASWADTNGLMQRWRLVQDIPWAVRNLVPQAARSEGGDPTAWRQRIVDLAAVRLTGRVLGEESNASALAYLEEDEGPTWQKVDHLTVLICRLPEANLK